MANGHVEVHDLLSTQTGPDYSTDTESMENTVEYRLLMAYAQRRRPNKEPSPPVSDITLVNDDIDGNVTTLSETTNKTEEKKKKKRKGWKCMPSIFRCLKPQRSKPTIENLNGSFRNRSLPSATPLSLDQQDEDTEEEKFQEVVSRLTEIADDIPFVPSDIEEDAPERKSQSSEDVAKMIALLLRKDGDRLNETMLKDANITKELFWNYSFYKELINALLAKMGLRTSDPEAPGPQLSPKTQIAVTCEITSRLSAVETLPMSCLWSHGAQYLQDYFSSWAQQQGGYEAAFEGDDDEVQ